MEAWWAEFTPFGLEGDPRVAVEVCLLSHDRRRALLEALAVDRGRAQRFFLSMLDKDGRLTVGVSHATDPERTPGVKRAVALLALQVHQQFPELQLDTTNLQEWLDT